MQRVFRSHFDINRDFFLWGYIKSRVYQTPLRTLDDLNQRIRDQVTQISPEILRNVMSHDQFSKTSSRMLASK